MGVFTRSYIQLTEALLDIIPPFHGGYSSRVKMWAPDRAITPQNEYAAMISETMYEAFCLPIDRTITNHFPYHSFHLHGGAMHQIDHLLSLDELSAIQLTLEHNVGGHPLEVMLPKIKSILQKKAMIVVVPDIETAEICIERLPAAGLCVLIMEGSYALDDKYDAWLEEHCLVNPI